jgi:HSP20 family protein
MALIKWSADPFTDLERAFQSSFDTFEARLAKRFGVRTGTYSPSVDIWEDPTNFYIIAELPGLTESDVSVTLEEDLLTISGKKERKEEKQDAHFHCIERTFGEFTRTLKIPANVRSNAIQASFKNGLLELTLPKIKTATSETRTIPLNTAKPLPQNGKLVSA